MDMHQEQLEGTHLTRVNALKAAIEGVAQSRLALMMNDPAPAPYAHELLQLIRALIEDTAGLVEHLSRAITASSGSQDWTHDALSPDEALAAAVALEKALTAMSLELRTVAVDDGAVAQDRLCGVGSRAVGSAAPDALYARPLVWQGLRENPNDEFRQIASTRISDGRRLVYALHHDEDGDPVGALVTMYDSDGSRLCDTYNARPPEIMRWFPEEHWPQIPGQPKRPGRSPHHSLIARVARYAEEYGYTYDEDVLD